MPFIIIPPNLFVGFCGNSHNFLVENCGNSHNLGLSQVFLLRFLNAGNNLYQPHHIDRQQGGFRILAQRLCVGKVTAVDSRRVFFRENIERTVRIVARRFNLNRTKFCASRQQEINLIIVLAAIRRESIVIEFVARGFQHLSHQVLVHIAQDFQCMLYP